MMGIDIYQKVYIKIEKFRILINKHFDIFLKGMNIYKRGVCNEGIKKDRRRD